ncbi:MAG: hypothetical protein ACE5JG_12300, partial [Planctomycetota bacterium]
MRPAVAAVFGMGIVGMIFLAAMSAVYLGSIPTEADPARLQADLKKMHAPYLASTRPLEVRLTRPEKEGERTGVVLTLALKPAVCRDPKGVEDRLERIARSVLRHPEWSGELDFVTVTHVGLNARSKTLRPPLEPAPPGTGPAGPARAGS